MAFDSRAGVVILYSGSTGGPDGKQFEDMWQWDGVHWTEIRMTGATPGYRNVAAMAYDAARDKTVLYGGYGCERGTEGCKVLDDTWEWDGKRWRLVSKSQSDGAHGD